ncbi:MAG TPA: tetratricopeptide repeat protein [bacterium]|nr:tetratricopeptide repeat protein [bacterium]
MSRYRGRLVVACAAAAVLIGAAAAGAAVPPYNDTAVYPTEAGFQQSIAVYQRAVSASTQDADAYYWLGVAYFQASVLWNQGLISYGADYLPRAIDALERAVTLNPAGIGAWLVLQEAYADAGDLDKSTAASDNVAALSHDLSLYNGAVPPVPQRGGPATVLPSAQQTQVVNPAGSAFRAGDFTYAGDPATKKLYPLSCRPLPPMPRLAIFFNKWDALAQGYTLVEHCP